MGVDTPRGQPVLLARVHVHSMHAPVRNSLDIYTHNYQYKVSIYRNVYSSFINGRR